MAIPARAFWQLKSAVHSDMQAASTGFWSKSNTCWYNADSADIQQKYCVHSLHVVRAKRCCSALCHRGSRWCSAAPGGQSPQSTDMRCS